MTNLFSDPVLTAFVWTLVHSLWQGMLAAVAAALVLLFTRKSRPSFRYMWLVLIMGFFVVMVLGTFFYLLQPYEPANPAFAPNTVSGPAVFSPALEKASVPDEIFPVNFIHPVSEWINRNSAILLMVWVVLFSIKCLRFITGYRYTLSVRRRGLVDIPDEWQERFRLLCERAGIRQQVRLLQSTLMKVPVVIGHFKPVILVPVALMANLPPAQVEAILLHELAHISRRDYLVNLLQGVTEAVFFFNPAFLWISHRVREEREACCDETVIASIPSRHTYLEALVSFHETRWRVPAALALAGRNGQLLSRVQRIIYHENQKLNTMEKTMIVLGMAGMAIAGMASSHRNVQVEPEQAIEQGISVQVANDAPQKVSASHTVQVTSIRDTVPPKEKPVSKRPAYPSTSYHVDATTQPPTIRIEARDENGKEYQILKSGTEVKEVRVDGKEVPAADFGQYQPVIKQIEGFHAQNTRMASMKPDEARRAQEMKMASANREKLAALRVEKIKANQERMQLRKETSAREQKLRAIELQQRKLERQQEEIQLKQKREQLIRQKSLDKKGVLFQNNRQSLSNDKVLAAILQQLLNDKLVDQTESVQFELDNNKFKVNGRKQSSEVHKQYKERFIKNEKDAYVYKRDGNTTTVSITRD